MSIETAAVALERLLPGMIERDAAVADLTTYRVGGPLSVLVRANDTRALRAVSRVLACEPLPVLVVGRGSNLLVAERGFAGVGIVLGGSFEKLEIVRDEGTVRAGAAVPLPVVARRSAAAGLTGLEFYVGIPGSVGGAVRMNAGGHGRETSEVLRRATVVDLGAGGASADARDREALGFGYRHSNLGLLDVVTGAELVGTPDDADACEERVAEVVRWRREHQPGGANAGSVFRNPPGDSAGRLIDAAGLKGLRVGGAVVSSKHANFFQADAGATADDVHGLVTQVRARVASSTGITLEPELRMIGFEDATEAGTTSSWGER